MKYAKLLSLIVIPILSASCSNQPNLANQSSSSYEQSLIIKGSILEGVVSNKTHGGNAKVLLHINDYSHSTGVVNGIMIVAKPLNGSGRFNGLITGDTCSFTKLPESGIGPAIHFKGKIQGSYFKGAFIVENFRNLGQQRGVFSLSQASNSNHTKTSIESTLKRRVKEEKISWAKPQPAQRKYVAVPRSRTLTASNGAYTASAFNSQIDGNFEGWDGDTIFKLRNGQIWQQSEYDYEYNYEFSPNVLIYPSEYGGWRMKVERMSNSIGVKRLK